MAVLIKEYAALRELVYKNWIHVRLIDLGRAMDALSHKYKETLILTALTGESEDLIGDRLGVTQQAISKRLGSALDYIVSYLNGEDPE